MASVDTIGGDAKTCQIDHVTKATADFLKIIILLWRTLTDPGYKKLLSRFPPSKWKKGKAWVFIYLQLGKLK